MKRLRSPVLVSTSLIILLVVGLSGCKSSEAQVAEFDVAAAVKCDFPEIKTLYPKFGPPPAPQENTPDKGSCWADDINSETAGFNQGYLTLDWRMYQEKKSIPQDFKWTEQGSLGSCEYGFLLFRESSSDDSRVNTISAVCNSNFTINLSGLFDEPTSRDLLKKAMNRLKVGD